MNKREPAAVIDKSDASWHFDRKVPIALIVTLALTVSTQTIAAFVWASKMDSRVEALERFTTAASPQGDRLTRVEVNIEAIKDSLTEIKATIRKPR